MLLVQIFTHTFSLLPAIFSNSSHVFPQYLVTNSILAFTILYCDLLHYLTPLILDNMFWRDQLPVVQHCLYCSACFPFKNIYYLLCTRYYNQAQRYKMQEVFQRSQMPGRREKVCVKIQTNSILFCLLYLLKQKKTKINNTSSYCSIPFLTISNRGDYN